MILENRDELTLIKLKQAIDLARIIDENNYYNLQQVIEAQHTIKALVKELVNYYGKLDYLKHAY